MQHKCYRCHLLTEQQRLGFNDQKLSVVARASVGHVVSQWQPSIGGSDTDFGHLWLMQPVEVWNSFNVGHQAAPVVTCRLCDVGQQTQSTNQVWTLRHTASTQGRQSVQSQYLMISKMVDQFCLPTSSADKSLSCDMRDRPTAYSNQNTFYFQKYNRPSVFWAVTGQLRQYSTKHWLQICVQWN